MFVFLRNRSLKSLHSLPPNFLLLQSKSLVAPFSSLQSEPKPNPTSERVKSLLRSHGLTEIQISKITKGRPRILSANPDKYLAPKIDFLFSIGISKTDLPKLLVHNIDILFRSLEKQLIPSHNSLKSVLVNDENVVKMLQHQSLILRKDFDKCIAHNIKLLTEIGVPKTLILQMLLKFSNVFCHSRVKFQEDVKEAIRLGFKPESTMFAHALRVLSVLSKTTWDRKVMIYKSWGLSDDEIGIAFRSHPMSMGLSEDKITKSMDIFVSEMGREAVDVVRSSWVLTYSIENRIKPRCNVIKRLISKGLLKKTISLSTFLIVSETRFLETYVSKYEDKVPELLSIYQERQSI